MDLEHAFRELRLGVEKFQSKLPTEKQEFVRSALKAAHEAYLVGDARRGAHLLQDIQDAWFPARFAEYERRKGEDA